MDADSLTLNETADPVALFARWLGEAKASEPNDPDAVALATVDASGLPDLRMVLMKGFDDRGFVFYTNQGSAKGRQLAGNARAALLFHWKSLRRQVRVRGVVEIVTDAEADAYFGSRARVSRLGAIASEQSRPLTERAILEARVAELDARYDADDIPRPAHWSGYRIVATEMELWQDGAYRLHDRIRFVRGTAGDAWSGTRLYP